MDGRVLGHHSSTMQLEESWALIDDSRDFTTLVTPCPLVCMRSFALWRGSSRGSMKGAEVPPCWGHAGLEEVTSG